MSKDKVYFREFTSSKGKKYMVGYPYDIDALDQTEIGHLETKNGKVDFGVISNWPVGKNDWSDTTGEVHVKASISQYKLWKDNGVTYDYELNFTNTKKYGYYFNDGEGDRYRVNTFRNGDHFLLYNSTSPAILYISGS